VNLPMLLKAITQRRRPVEEVVEELIATGQGAIRAMRPEDREAR
jgi:mannose/fructose-specific phosphotransferase system component IIA